MNTSAGVQSRKKPSRKGPGVGGEGDYYRIEVRPKHEFVSFRYHDVGEDNGDLQRLAGKRADGSWDTHSWLVSKQSAHIENDTLVADSQDVQELLETLQTHPKLIKQDIFTAPVK